MGVGEERRTLWKKSEGELMPCTVAKSLPTGVCVLSSGCRETNGINTV